MTDPATTVTRRAALLSPLSRARQKRAEETRGATERWDGLESQTAGMYLVRRRPLVLGAFGALVGVLVGRPGLARGATSLSDLPGPASPPAFTGFVGPLRRLMRETIEAVVDSEQSSLPGGAPQVERALARLDEYYARADADERARIDEKLTQWRVATEQAGWPQKGHAARRDILRTSLAESAPDGPGRAIARLTIQGFVPVESNVLLPLTF